MSAHLPSGLAIKRETDRILILIFSLFYLQDIYLSLFLCRVRDIPFFCLHVNVTGEYSRSDILEGAFAVYFNMQISALASRVMARQR